MLDEFVPNNELIMFAAVLIFGFASGLARTLKEQTYRSIWHSLSVAGVSGFLAFSICAVTLRPPYEGKVWLALGMASAIGLAGRELTDHIILRLLRRLGFLDNESDKARPDDSNSA